MPTGWPAPALAGARADRELAGARADRELAAPALIADRELTSWP
jgi:hypothetical protein